MSNKPLIVLAFANSTDQPLDSLEREYSAVFDIMTSVKDNFQFEIYPEPLATPAKLIELLSRRRDSIALLHYSGHALRDQLLMRDQPAMAKGLAQLLGKLPKLQCLFLNGCSTQGQVKLLLENGVKSVIATSAPVDDEKATNFSIDFYREMARGKSVRESFNMAKAKLETLDAKIEFQSFRGISQDDLENGVWGIFENPENPPINDWGLGHNVQQNDLSFKPNELFFKQLPEILKSYDQELSALLETLPSGSGSLSVVIPAILKSLPLPVSEHLQKLFAPNDADDKNGYDDFSQNRLFQLVELYLVLVDLTIFTMLGQLFSVKTTQPDIELSVADKNLVRNYFLRPPRTDLQFDFIGFVRTLRAILDKNQLPYFVEELSQLKETVTDDSPFFHSVKYLESLRSQIAAGNVSESNVALFCKEAEEHLCTIFSYLGFMSRYKLISVELKDVLKNWRYPVAQYQFNLVDQVIYDVKKVREDLVAQPIDNRSVLLARKSHSNKSGTFDYNYLNLSPFLFDRRAFSAKHEKSEIFFFWNYDQKRDAYQFRYIRQPYENERLDISDESFRLIKEQFDEFALRVFGLPMSIVMDASFTF